MPILRVSRRARRASVTAADCLVSMCLARRRVAAQQAAPGARTLVQAFGDAAGLGSPAAGADLPGLAATSTGHGYWVVDRQGQVSAFGDAGHFGDMTGVRLAAPV